MARRAASRFLRGATNWGTAAAPLGPKVAVPVAVAGGLFESLQGDPKLNRRPYDKAFENYTRGAWRDTRRAGRELGSQRGARLAARGINESALGDYLHGANNAKLYAGTQRHINDARANLESQIAHAEDMMQQGTSAIERNRWGQTRNMLIEKLDTYANPEEKTKPTASELTQMMEAQGFDKSTIAQYLKNLGLNVNTAPVYEPQRQPSDLPTAPIHPQTESLVPESVPQRTTPPPRIELPESIQDSSSNRGFPMMPQQSPDTSLKMGTPGFGPPKQSMVRQPSPTVMKAKEELGDFIVDYLTDALGEEFADIFEWGTA